MNEHTTGYLLIEYGYDENRYNVFLRREDAEKMFIDKAREYASIGGIYSPEELLLKIEIAECVVHKEK